MRGNLDFKHGVHIVISEENAFNRLFGREEYRQFVGSVVKSMLWYVLLDILFINVAQLLSLRYPFCEYSVPSITDITDDRNSLHNSADTIDHRRSHDDIQDTFLRGLPCIWARLRRAPGLVASFDSFPRVSY